MDRLAAWNHFAVQVRQQNQQDFIPT